MASWDEFRAAAPELSAIADSRIDVVGLCLVGTLRKGGWPRVSPVEPLVVGGTLYLGMMWQSQKALDLLRDPRCVVHSVVTDRSGAEGDIKVYGLAIDEVDAERRERYGAALFDRIAWRPEGPFHLFAVDVVEVGYFRVTEGGHDVRHWRPASDGGSGA